MRPLLAIGLITLAACGAPDMRSDWERKHETQLAPPEETLPLPAYPRAGLIEFATGPTSEFRFFVDPASLSVGEDRVVRFTLVARSPAGAENVSYEGIRCATSEVRLYAIGRDGAWARRTGEWRRFQPTQTWHYVLADEYFCPLKAAVSNRNEALDALRRGGHPFGRDPRDVPMGR